MNAKRPGAPKARRCDLRERTTQRRPSKPSSAAHGEAERAEPLLGRR